MASFGLDFDILLDTIKLNLNDMILEDIYEFENYICEFNINKYAVNKELYLNNNSSNDKIYDLDKINKTRKDILLIFESISKLSKKEINTKDNVIENSSNSLLVENDICGNYKVNDNKLEETDQKFLSEMKSFYKAHESEGLYRPCETVTTKVQVKASGVGISAILTFLGLYLGIIFSITSAAVLAIQQLSQSSDNKERYEVLRKIGAETKIINRSLFIQIAIYFMLPLSLALVHSVVGLSEVNKLISIFGHIDLTANIVITATFIILVYGGYFIATYMASKSIIKERERSE
jgi:putative ABC transport system permease protein